ncbi:MAG TPA: VCBS repeat-containing protein [Terracidiphilus sp.]|nr:VCBS repeat-containing protein [Terracidiphilus sp.]
MLIATADFNSDGIADVAEVTLLGDGQNGAGVLTILLGQRNGSFKPSLRHTLLRDDPRSIAAGDFNGDGKPDLLVGDGDGAVLELLGDGKGDLRLAGEIAHVGSAVSIAVGDFNRDGIPDIAVSDFRSNNVTILLGSGKGPFRFGWSFALPMRGTTYYLAAADFNSDGVPDLAITSDEEGMFLVMLGNGNGTFTYAPALSRIRDPYSYCPT